MKFLIVLAFVAAAHATPQYYNSFAIPTVLPDGHLADTPEVASAKLAHYAEQAKALSGAPVPVAPVVSPYDTASIYNPYYKSYSSGPFAIPTVLPDGHLADTPEVAAAKVAHFSEHAKALASAPAPVASVYSPYYKSYSSGAYAVPTVLPDGHLADTPEVAAAKVAHFSEHAKALASAPAPLATVYSPYYKSYSSGAYAVPTVLPDGHLADTPEVAVAKAFHLAEHAKAAYQSGF